MHVADSSDSGYLSSTDWSTFNGKQAALSILKGTYVDGDLCTYTLTGTLLNCNTAPGGTGTVTDGSGTTTTPEFAESTGTAHVIQYRTPTQARGDMGAAPAVGSTTDETGSWNLVANNVYRFTGSGASNATTPATVGATGLINFVNAGTANVTVVTGGPTLVCIPSSCVVPVGASVLLNADSSDQYAIISNAVQINGGAVPASASLLGSNSSSQPVSTSFLKGYMNGAQGYVLPTGAYSAAFGLYCYGNSITGGVGLPTGATAWCADYAQLLNITNPSGVRNNGATGLSTAGSLACALGACGYGSQMPVLSDYNTPLTVEALGMNNALDFGMTAADVTYLQQTYGADLVWHAMTPAESLVSYVAPISTTGTSCGTGTVTFQLTNSSPGTWNMLPDQWDDIGYAFAASAFGTNTGFNTQTFTIQNLPTYSATGYSQITIPYSGSCTPAGTETGTLTLNAWTTSGTVTTDTTTFYVGTGGSMTFKALSGIGAYEQESALPIGGSGELFVWYVGYGSGGGTGTISVNGTVQTDQITGSSTLSGVLGEHSGFDPSTAVYLAIFTGQPANSIPTVKVTSTSANKFAVLRIASPQGNLFSSHVPKVGVFGVNYEETGTSDTPTAFYDSAIKQWVKTLATTYGLTNISPIDQRARMNTNSDFTGGIGSCPSSGTPVHPGCGGQFHMAQAAFDDMGVAPLPPFNLNTVTSLGAAGTITAEQLPGVVFLNGYNLKFVGGNYPSGGSNTTLFVFNPAGGSSSTITWTNSGSNTFTVPAGCGAVLFWGGSGPQMIANSCPTSAVNFSGSLAGDTSGPQGATVTGKINGVSMAGLGSGILYNTTGTGVPSITTQAQFTAAMAAQYKTGSCTEAFGGSGTSHALTSGDDAVANNTCYNDSGVTRTITAVKCRSDNASNTTTVNPAFGSAGTGTTILSGALTCGNSYAYSSTGTVSNASWITGTGIDPVMGGSLTGTSIAMIVEYTY